MQREPRRSLKLLPLEIGGVRIDLRCSASDEAASRLSPFASGRGQGRWRIAVRPSRTPPSHALARRVIADGDLLRVEGAEELGWLDPASRCGEVLSEPSAVVLAPLLRAMVAIDVAAAGGCLFHAAAVVVGGAGYLLPGRSGAGKSTFASLARDPLADEVAVVLPANGGYSVHGTPWWSGRPGSAPLAAVYSLAWGGEAIEPLGPADAVRSLASSLVVPIGGPPALGRAFHVATAVAATIPFARLSFRLDSDVDAILRRGATGRLA